jgi:hypothetical protein
VISSARVALSRTAKSAIFYSIIGIAGGVGIMFVITDCISQTLRHDETLLLQLGAFEVLANGKGIEERAVGKITLPV